MSPSQSASAEPSLACGRLERPPPRGAAAVSSLFDLPAQLSPIVDSQTNVAVEKFPNTEDFTHIVGLGWKHGFQPAPDALIGVLNRKSLLPTTSIQTRAHFYIDGRSYTTELGQGTREPTLNNPGRLNIMLIPGYGFESQEALEASIEGDPEHTGETSSSTKSAASTTELGQGTREPTLNNPGGLNIMPIPGHGFESQEAVEASIEGDPEHTAETPSPTKAAASTTPPMDTQRCGLWSCFAGIGKALRGSPRKRSSAGLAGPGFGLAIDMQQRLLPGKREKLKDQHITADYALLERELQSNNPDLAARTRLLRPAEAQVLRLIEGEIALMGALQGHFLDEHDNDTADFLFVPLNDGKGAKADDGTHWSLLLVDRHQRERVVAYHYDSFGGANLTVAAQLATRLGANLQPARIPRQGNRYDCGVFVVDGTRALVGRLAQGERPDDEPLHLDNLVADRQALLNRLKGLSSLPR